MQRIFVLFLAPAAREIEFPVAIEQGSRHRPFYEPPISAG
jgi:hypothetical protein